MKVKALCNKLYNGVMYRAGDVFEADKVLPNTVSAEEKGIKDEPAAEISQIPDMYGDLGTKSNKKRR